VEEQYLWDRSLGKVSKLDVGEIKRLATASLLNRFGENLEAVVLFGSYSRTEAVEESGIDFFVVVRGLPKELVRRRYMVYDALTPVLRRFKRDVSVIEVNAEDVGGKSLLY
jgi:predicted nucleotidyltransferase